MVESDTVKLSAVPKHECAYARCRQAWLQIEYVKNASVAQLDRARASDFSRLRGQIQKKLLYVVGVGNLFGNKTTMHKKITPKITPSRIAYKLSAKTICACSLIG